MEQPESLEASLRNVVVVMYPQEILLTHLDNETATINIVDWLKNVLDDADDQPISE